ncbi:hypothetical protein AeNC1_019498, partial [Aphanomyces euteiches]
MNRDAWS